MKKQKKQLSGCLFCHVSEKCLMPPHLKITSSKALHQTKTPEISSISSNNWCCCANTYILKHTNYLSNITFEFKMFAFLTAGTPQDHCHVISHTYQFLLTSYQFLEPVLRRQPSFWGCYSFLPYDSVFLLMTGGPKIFHHKL